MVRCRLSELNSWTAATLIIQGLDMQDFCQTGAASAPRFQWDRRGSDGEAEWLCVLPTVNLAVLANVAREVCIETRVEKIPNQADLNREFLWRDETWF